jgi:hypothetical protein
MDDKKKQENNWLGQEYTSENEKVNYFKEGFAIVTVANIKPVRESNVSNAMPNEALVILELRRISDGLESKFESKEDAARIREFLKEGRVKTNIYLSDLKGKIMDVRYSPDDSKVMQVKMNKYAFLDV